MGWRKEEEGEGGEYIAPGMAQYTKGKIVKEGGDSGIARNILECIVKHSFFIQMQTNEYVIKTFVCLFFTLFTITFLTYNK